MKVGDSFWYNPNDKESEKEFFAARDFCNQNGLMLWEVGAKNIEIEEEHTREEIHTITENGKPVEVVAPVKEKTVRYQIVKLYEIQEPEVVKPTLEEAKEQKIKELKMTRDIVEQNGFAYLGKIFDSDQVSVLRLTSAAQTAQIALANNQPFEVIWTCKDNTLIKLSAEQMIGAIPALAKNSATLHEKCSILKERVKEAITVEEVKSINW